ncbi:MAG: hypothetical protein ACM31C_09630 [Acidobacteriota bacterium]
MIVVLAVAGVAHADDYTALPCRPTIACTADFVPPGVLEIESGYLYRRLAGGVNQSSLPFLVKLTLAPWAQLQVGSNGPTLQGDAHYLDDVTAGLKVQLRRQTAHVPSISLSATASVPTFAASGYLRTYDALAIAYVTKDLGWLHADWNLGLSAWRLDATTITQAWTALALSTPLGAGFGAMLEGYTFSDAAPIAPRDAGILAAVSYQPRWWIVLDAGPDVGLTATRVASAFAGVTFIAGELW